MFSSITPRTDSGPANLKVQNVNLSLKILCSQSNVKFIDIDGTFLTSNKSPNDALLLDGLHLNDRGTTNLITNLGIEAFPKKRRPKQTTRINNNNYIPPFLPTNNQGLLRTYGSHNYSSQKPQHTPPSGNNLPRWNEAISWSDQQRIAWIQPVLESETILMEPEYHRVEIFPDAFEPTPSCTILSTSGHILPDL